MTNEEINKVKRIFDKCLEVNSKGNAEVFVRFSPHVSLITVSIHSPSWKDNKDGKSMDFYFDNLAAGCSLELVEDTIDLYM